MLSIVTGYQMTEKEYLTKRSNYMASFAEIELKEKMIKALDLEYEKYLQIRRDIEEGRADISDMGDN